MKLASMYNWPAPTGHSRGSTPSGRACSAARLIATGTKHLAQVFQGTRSAARFDPLTRSAGLAAISPTRRQSQNTHSKSQLRCSSTPGVCPRVRGAPSSLQGTGSCGWRPSDIEAGYLRRCGQRAHQCCVCRQIGTLHCLSDQAAHQINDTKSESCFSGSTSMLRLICFSHSSALAVASRLAFSDRSNVTDLTTS